VKLSPSSLVKSEPVLVAHFVAWLLLQAGLILVGRYHVLSDSSWSALSSALAPIVTAAAMGLLALLIRHVVTPVANWIEHEVGPLAGPVIEDVQKAITDAQAVYPMPEAATAAVMRPDPMVSGSQPAGPSTPVA